MAWLVCFAQCCVEFTSPQTLRGTMKRGNHDMTNVEAKNLKYGDRIYYGRAAGIVQRVASNGVIVSYDGMGLKSGQYITERVAARYLTKRK
jgi:hypothetical protein